MFSPWFFKLRKHTKFHKKTKRPCRTTDVHGFSRISFLRFSRFVCRRLTFFFNHGGHGDHGEERKTWINRRGTKDAKGNPEERSKNQKRIFSATKWHERHEISYRFDLLPREAVLRLPPIRASESDLWLNWSKVVFCSYSISRRSAFSRPYRKVMRHGKWVLYIE